MDFIVTEADQQQDMEGEEEEEEKSSGNCKKQKLNPGDVECGTWPFEGFGECAEAVTEAATKAAELMGVATVILVEAGRNVASVASSMSVASWAMVVGATAAVTGVGIYAVSTMREDRRQEQVTASVVARNQQYEAESRAATEEIVARMQREERMHE